MQATLQHHDEEHTGSVMARSSPLGTRYDFYLNKQLKCDNNVISLVNTLREAQPQDQVYIHLNCPGGQLRAAAQILTAMRDTQAHVVTCAEGEVYSGASLIFFAGNSFLVSEFSNFMLHNASGGSVGVINDMMKDLENTQSWIEKIYKSVYIPFFESEEIDILLDSGKDWFITPEEVAGRIDKVQSKMARGNKEPQIVIHVAKDSEDTDEIKQFIKAYGLGKRVKLHVSEVSGTPVLIGISGQYQGQKNVMSYLKGYFAYERKNS